MFRDSFSLGIIPTRSIAPKSGIGRDYAEIRGFETIALDSGGDLRLKIPIREQSFLCRTSTEESISSVDLKQITITLVPFVTTTTDGGAIEEGQKKRFCLQDLSLLWWFHRKFLKFHIIGFLGFSLLKCEGIRKL